MKCSCIFALASAFALTACGGGSLASPSPATSSAPVAAGVAFANAGGASINSLTFDGAGAANAQTIVATQLDGNASLHESDTCASSRVASIKAGSDSAGSATYTVTPQNAGACTITVSGANGYSATLDVSITLTNVPIQ